MPKIAIGDDDEPVKKALAASLGEEEIANGKQVREAGDLAPEMAGASVIPSFRNSKQASEFVGL